MLSKKYKCKKEQQTKRPDTTELFLNTNENYYKKKITELNLQLIQILKIKLKKWTQMNLLNLLNSQHVKS